MSASPDAKAEPKAEAKPEPKGEAKPEASVDSVETPAEGATAPAESQDGGSLLESASAVEAPVLPPAEDGSNQDLRGELVSLAVNGAGDDAKALIAGGVPTFSGYDLGACSSSASAVDLAMFHRRPELSLSLLTAAGSVRGERTAQELAQRSVFALAWASRDGRTRLVNEMLRLRASPGNSKDERGRSPLVLATLRGHSTIVEALLEQNAWNVEPEPNQVRKWVRSWKMEPVFDAAQAPLNPGEKESDDILSPSRRKIRKPWQHQREVEEATAKGKPPPVDATSTSRSVTPRTGRGAGQTPSPPPQTKLEPVKKPPAGPASNAVLALRLQDGLRLKLVRAMQTESCHEIEDLMRRGAPLVRHYPPPHMDPCLAGRNMNEALVNPLDWAVLAFKFRAATTLVLANMGMETMQRAHDIPLMMGNGENTYTKSVLVAEAKVALHGTAAQGHLPLLKLLLEATADVSRLDGEGASALLHAARRGQGEAASLLLQRGAWRHEQQKSEVLAAARANGVESVLEVGAELCGFGEAAEVLTLDAPVQDVPVTRYRVINSEGLPVREGVELNSPIVGVLAKGSVVEAFDRRVSKQGVVRLRLSAGWASEHSIADGTPLVELLDSAREKSKDLARTPSESSTMAPYSPAPDSSHAPLASPSSQRAPSSAFGMGSTMTTLGDGRLASPSPSQPRTMEHRAMQASCFHPYDGSALTWRELTAEEKRLRGDLLHAIRKGDISKLHSAVDRGAPLDSVVDLPHGLRGNCVDWACAVEQPGTALELLRCAKDRGQGEAVAVGARAALLWATSQGYKDVLKELLELRADIGRRSAAPCGGNQTALAVAVFGSRPTEAELLLRHGAWDHEPEESRAELLRWAKVSNPIATVLAHFDIR